MQSRLVAAFLKENRHSKQSSTRTSSHRMKRLQVTLKSITASARLLWNKWPSQSCRLCAWEFNTTIMKRSSQSLRINAQALPPVRETGQKFWASTWLTSSTKSLAQRWAIMARQRSSLPQTNSWWLRCNQLATPRSFRMTMSSQSNSATTAVSAASIFLTQRCPWRSFLWSTQPCSEEHPGWVSTISVPLSLATST